MRLVGGDASLNGAELFQIEADFSAEIVTFRLVGGMHPPLNPPLPMYCRNQRWRNHIESGGAQSLSSFFTYSAQRAVISLQ